MPAKNSRTPIGLLNISPKLSFLVKLMMTTIASIPKFTTEIALRTALVAERIF